ncbi:hypothetical protein M406DRAFT_333770 [Cryphonectria parasitica EP155]|uniref:Uncharacterized protein n=1 Tax=Cryphonectria parasitica (strain ATCC 38755 / EP155) TaxID=660469 RepID=A0A9P5CL02_CRYP1|nr:uncharacterized protein M406DRAFT_333770 [Cryphonectria parasitica EP155]KAF3761717.1 hypothetical protein M406DRAFT_333770 [Cryphonectria parasitica EP155]
MGAMYLLSLISRPWAGGQGQGQAGSGTGDMDEDGDLDEERGQEEDQILEEGRGGGTAGYERMIMSKILSRTLSRFPVPNGKGKRLPENGYSLCRSAQEKEPNGVEKA